MPDGDSASRGVPRTTGKIEYIALDGIEIADRMRPATQEAVGSLAADMRARGLRMPVEVAKIDGGRYRLVAGAHRCAAATLLGWAEIAAIVVRGNRLELLRDELLENLTRNELSMLERAQFLAKLKTVYEELYPETRQGVAGGKARQNSATAKLAFAESVVARSGLARRTIERAAAIGARLSPDTADRLRGTKYEDNQKELEALAHYGPEVQTSIVDRLLAAERPAPTVKSAVAAIQGAPAEPEAETATTVRKWLDLWNRATPGLKRRLVDELVARDLLLVEKALAAARKDDR